MPDSFVEVSEPEVPDVPGVVPFPVPDVPDVELSMPDEPDVELPVPDVLVSDVPEVPVDVLPVPDEPDVPVPVVELPEPDVPVPVVELPDPEVPLPEVLSEEDDPLDEPVDGVVLPMPEPEDVSLPVPDEPLLFGSTVVVVVVTLPEPLLPEDGLEPEVAESDFVGSDVVVVVVVVCPYVIVAVPSSDRKMAIGNFFMLAP